MVSQKTTVRSNFTRHADLLVCLFLVAATLTAYWQVKEFEFIDYDDTDYVSQNPPDSGRALQKAH